MAEPIPPQPEYSIFDHTIIIVGLSGGPDSICLLHYLFQQSQSMQNFKIIAVHLDHEWQESSKIAAQTCINICKELGIELIIKKLSELEFDAKWNGSQEEFGRNMRRHFFQSVAQQYQATAIALAHHQQDQHETFFIRLIRGSSLAGLTGMKEEDGLYIRPLLSWSKQNIIDYIEQHQLLYYTDPTNISDAYLRNRIRNHLIPAMNMIDSRSAQNLTSTMQQLSQAHDFIQQQIISTLKIIQTDQGIKISSFLSLHTILQQGILLKIMIQHNVSFNPSQKLLKEIVRFLKNKSNKTHQLHQSWMIVKDFSDFFIIKMIKNDKNL